MVGFFDPCRLLETDPKKSDNVWTADTDGDLHPNSAGHQRYADAMAASLLVDAPNPIPPAASGGGK